MFEWMKKRVSMEPDHTVVVAPVARPQGRKVGRYQRLYEYLENRYADTVVLTFQQIEDLLGFTLPDLARQDDNWWAVGGADSSEARCSDAWTLASRTAQPNLRSQVVIFQRVA
jgi:hypothetical protein